MPPVLVVAGTVCHIPLTKTALPLAVGRSTARRSELRKLRDKALLTEAIEVLAQVSDPVLGLSEVAFLVRQRVTKRRFYSKQVGCRSAQALTDSVLASASG